MKAHIHKIKTRISIIEYTILYSSVAMIATLLLNVIGIKTTYYDMLIITGVLLVLNRILGRKST